MSDAIPSLQVDAYKNNAVGVYYRRPVEGDVVLTYGFGPGYINYRTEKGPSGIASREEFDTWELMVGARDFINAEDPRLPSEFDLHYDTHYLSQLIAEFGSLSECLDDEHIVAMCKHYGIDLRDPQTIRDYNEKVRLAAVK